MGAWLRRVAVAAGIALWGHGGRVLAAPEVEARQGPKYRYALDLDPATRSTLADKKRDEAIGQLEKLIPRFDDANPEKPDLYFQLSEFYWEKYKYLYDLEEKRYERRYAEYQQAVSRGERGPEPQRDHADSEKYRADAVRLYESILRDFPGYPRTDEVLFSLAYNLRESNRQAEAAARYEELIKRFPGSRLVPDAYIQLGDHWFDHNQLARARTAYERAYESDVPKIHSYALYKLAWCDFNVEDYDRALERLQAVVAFAEAHGREMVDLKNEALNDLVLVYVRLDRAQDAIAYFERKASRERQTKLIARLADELVGKGRHDSAIRTYRYLLDRDPLRPEAPEYQGAIAKAYEAMHDRARVKEEVERLARLYRPGGEWWRANARQEAVLKNAFEVSEEAMRTLVTDYHQEAQRTKQVETYRLARDIYKQYVDAFASSSDPRFVSDQAFNLRFYYAEILWTLEEWEAAAAAYDAVVAFKIPDRASAREVANEGYRKSAAYNAILAWNKLLKIERGELTQSDLKDGQKVDEAKRKGDVEKGGRLYRRSAKELEEKPLTRIEERLLAACDAYTRLFPGEKDELNVRYQAAVILYDKSHFVEAAKRFGEIILKWPEEERSQQAADLTLYILDARGAWFELSQLSKQFLENEKLCRPGTDFTRRVASIVEGSRYKWIDEVVYKKEKDPRRAGEEFMKFVQDFPRSKTADRALTYAMLMFQETHQLDRGIAAGERALEAYPSSPLEPKVRYNLARMYEQTADFARSARMYESFVASFDRHARLLVEARERWKREKERAPARAKAGDAEQGGAAGAGPAGSDVDRESADAVAGELDERGRLLDEARDWLADAQFNAGVWYEGLGQSDKALAVWRQYIARFKDRKDVPEIAYNMGLLYEKDGRWREAARAFEDFDRTYHADPRTTGAQHFLAKYRQLEAYRRMRDTREVERLQDELVRGFNHLSADDRKDGAVLSAYAHARFLALEPLWKAYTDIRLTRVSTVKRDLLEKKKKLQEIERAYGDVLDIGEGEYGIAALVRIGLAYADMAKSIVDSPNPHGLTQDQIELYRGELDKLSMPLEDKAAEALEKALARASELSVYDEWTLQAQEQLNKYRPGLYAGIRDVQYRASEPFVTAPLERSAAARAQANGAAPPPPPGKTEEQVFAEGVAAFEAGHYDEARAAFIEALRKVPDDVNAQYDLGVVAERQGDLSRARAAYEAARKLDPAHLPTLLNLGRVYRLQERLDLAIGLYDEAVRLPGRELDPSLLTDLSAAYRLAKQYDKAEATARRALARADEAGAYESLALVYYDQGRYRLAELMCTSARRLDEKDPGIDNNLGLIYLKLEEPARALARFQKALSLDDAFVPGYFNVGALALSHRDHGNAERAFARALELDPTSYEARLYYAYALDGQKGREPGKGLAAGAAFEQALALRPDRPEAICGAGWAYAAVQEGWGKAVPFLERCKVLRRDSPQEQQLIDAKLKGISAMQKLPPSAPPPEAPPAPGDRPGT